jgi:zinc protease
MLGVSGDFDAKAMRKTLETAFANWPKGTVPSFAKLTYRTTPNPGVFFVEKADVTQANIAMAHLGIEQTNPDFFAVQVMNEILGGGFSGRLANQIRTKGWPTVSPAGSARRSIARA